MTEKISIVKGTIYNEKMEEVVSAVVQVSEVDPSTQTSKNLGYTITDINGGYTFAISALADKFYQFSIYPPLDV